MRSSGGGVAVNTDLPVEDVLSMMATRDQYQQKNFPEQNENQVMRRGNADAGDRRFVAN